MIHVVVGADHHVRPEIGDFERGTRQPVKAFLPLDEVAQVGIDDQAFAISLEDVTTLADPGNRAVHISQSLE
jgi:hypothetical protein